MSLIFCAVLHFRVLFVFVLCVLFPACQCLYIVKSFPLRSGSDHIGGVMVGVFTSSAVDRGLEPRSDQTKDYKIDICCFSAMAFTLKMAPMVTFLQDFMTKETTSILPL